jgi:cell shape-determining protein MreD
MGLRFFYLQVEAGFKDYIKENWGVPFIIGFLMLLLSAAVLLAAGYISTAEMTANVAYFTLAAGVFLELICLGKNRQKGEKVLNGSS